MHHISHNYFLRGVDNYNCDHYIKKKYFILITVQKPTTESNNHNIDNITTIDFCYILINSLFNLPLHHNIMYQQMK